jgi:hypothetical protein
LLNVSKPLNINNNGYFWGSLFWFLCFKTLLRRWGLLYLYGVLIIFFKRWKSIFNIILKYFLLYQTPLVVDMSFIKETGQVKMNKLLWVIVFKNIHLFLHLYFKKKSLSDFTYFQNVFSLKKYTAEYTTSFTDSKMIYFL